MKTSNYYSLKYLHMYLTEFSKNLERIEQFERVKVLLKRIISSYYEVLISKTTKTKTQQQLFVLFGRLPVYEYLFCDRFSLLGVAGLNIAKHYEPSHEIVVIIAYVSLERKCWHTQHL